MEPIQPHADTTSADDDRARLRVCENTLSRLRFAAFGQRYDALERVREILREHDERVTSHTPSVQEEGELE